MSQAMRMWMEVGFNLVYLVVIWGVVVAMALHRGRVRAEEWPVARLFLAAFALLALGDTGHVGFRVLAFAGGDLGRQITLGGVEVGLVGLGALATAVTVTLFYLVILRIWRVRFGRALGWFGWLLVGMAVLRFAIMLFPQNAWSSPVPPQPWSLWRNLPLMVLGVGVAGLILRDARQAQDRTFIAVGWAILVSYAFYTPVILFVQRAPAVGMLMIPKTLAYGAIALLAWRRFYALSVSVENSAACALDTAQ